MRNKSTSKRKRAGVAVSRRSSANSAMRVTSRIVDTKRHTTGYVIGGKRYSVKQVAQLARQGRISGVRAVGNHPQAVNGRRCLSSLPTKVEKK